MKYLNPVLLIMSLLGLPALAQDLASLSELGQGNELSWFSGEGNQAHLWQLGSDNELQLSQSGNDNQIRLMQQGQQQQLRLDQVGDNNWVDAVQLGVGNSAELYQAGIGNQIWLWQRGWTTRPGSARADMTTGHGPFSSVMATWPA